MPSSRSRLRLPLVAAAALALASLVGCAASSAPTASDASSAAGQGSLETVSPGKLTIATGQPVYEPWVIGEPEGGEGFEAAVAYAVASQLGYDEQDVVWVRTDFDSAIQPGPKDFDFNLQQYSITEDRKKAVDFSSSYYTTSQAIVTVEANVAAAAVTDIAGLEELTVGVASGTTSYAVFTDQVGVQPQVFNSNEDAVLALTSGQIDALAVDLPTAFYLAGAELTKGKIIGQFADTTGGDEYGLLLAKGSALTDEVSAAVDALRDDGTLAALAEEWLSTTVDVPVLQ